VNALSPQSLWRSRIFQHAALVLLASFVLWVPGQVLAGDAATRVSFLLNFGRFTEWSAESLPPAAGLHYCVASGDGELWREAQALEKSQAQGHSIKVFQVTRPLEVNGCHTLYLPTDLAGPLEPYLAAAERAGALTVSDIAGFAEKGGMVELVLISGRYRFDINLGAVKRAHLYVNTNLLKLARSVL
jgi:hypothetical protein